MLRKRQLLSRVISLFKHSAFLRTSGSRGPQPIIRLAQLRPHYRYPFDRGLSMNLPPLLQLIQTKPANTPIYTTFFLAFTLASALLIACSGKTTDDNKAIEETDASADSTAGASGNSHYNRWSFRIGRRGWKWRLFRRFRRWRQRRVGRRPLRLCP
jgi:hypothetical protein